MSRIFRHANFLLAINILVTSWMCSATYAEDRAKAETTEDDNLLTVGSAAPELDVEHWVNLGEGKFKPVSKFAEGHVYVVEFWATWCGPCIQSMPHLAELQRRHADDNVQIISISDEELEVVETFLNRKVKPTPKKTKSDAKEKQKSKDDAKAKDEPKDAPKTYRELTSAYCLTTDPDNSTHEAYMDAAVQSGIPTAFIVGKTGHIEWVGHPVTMDEPLREIIAGQWDRDAFAVEFRLKQQFKLMTQEALDLADEDRYDEGLQLMVSAKKLADGQFEKSADMYYQHIRLQKFKSMAENGEAADALKTLNSDIAAAEAKTNRLLKQRFEVFVSAGEFKRAAAELRGLAKKLSSRSLNSMTWAIYENAVESGDASPILLEAAIDAAQVAADADPKNPSIVDTLAHLVHIQGDLDRAIQLQTHAVSLLKAPHKGIEGYLAELKQEKEGNTEKSKPAESKDEATDAK